jgi:hypothetical protein
MTYHAKLSPSARVRWGSCPGSVREEAKYPKRPSGPAAIDGTHTHTLLESCLLTLDLDGKITDPKVFIGATLKDDDGEFTVDAERAERVRFAIDYIRSRMVVDPLCQVIAEKRVHPDSLVLRDDMSGTVDVQIISGDGESIEIIDYKDGMGVVEAAGNPQLEPYAVGVIAEIMDKGQLAPMYVRLTIIQPKLRLKGMTGVSYSDTTLGAIMQAKDKMIVEAAATEAPDAPLVPGEAQCKFCAHKGSCSALATKSMAASGVLFQNLSAVIPVAGIAQQSADKDPATMSDAQIVEIMEAAPLLRQMIEAVEKEAQNRLEAGHTIDGLKLVNGRGARSWNVSEDEIAAKLKKMGVPKDSIYESKLVSVAKAEKLSWKKGEELISLSDRQLAQMKEFISTVVGKPVIALASDSRKSVTISAATLFPVVDHSDAIPSWLL